MEGIQDRYRIPTSYIVFGIGIGCAVLLAATTGKIAETVLLYEVVLRMWVTMKAIMCTIKAMSLKVDILRIRGSSELLLNIRFRGSPEIVMWLVLLEITLFTMIALCIMAIFGPI